jgi:hypothetical protein
MQADANADGQRRPPTADVERHIARIRAYL